MIEAMPIERLEERPRRPLIGWASSFAVGCALAEAGPTAPTGVLLIGAAAALAVAVLFAQRRWATAPLLAATLLIGGLHGRLSRPGAAPRDLMLALERDREYLRVAGAPSFRPAADTGGEPEWRFDLRVESLNRAGAEWRRARGALAVRLRAAHDFRPLRHGDRIALSGVVRRTPDARGALPMRARSDTLRLLAAAGPSWMERCLAARAAAARALSRGIEAYPMPAAVIRALLLGLREDIPESVRERFLQTGAMHIFAISGLHVGIIAGFGFALLRFIGVSRRFECLALAPMLAAYVTATGLAPSAVRAGVMALAYAAASLFGRKPDVRSAFAFAAFAILAADATQIRDIGFLYSFVVVAGLLTFAPPLLRPLKNRFAPDAAAATARARSARAAVRYALLPAVFSLAAWLASAPLMARFANLFAPGALVGNLIALPAASLIALTGGLSLAAGAVSGVWAEIFNHANRVFAETLVSAMERLSEVPGAHWNVKSPPIWAIAGAYAAIAGLLALRGRPRRVLAIAAALTVAAAAAHMRLDRRVTVHALDDARGGAVLIEGPRAATVLVDAGPKYRAPALIRHFRSRGINRLDALVLTRADADRAGAAPDIAARFPIARAIVPDAPARSRVFADTLARLRERGVVVETVARGDRVELPDGAELEIFHPARGGRYSRAEEGALVFRWGRGAAAVLVIPSGTAAAPRTSLSATGLDAAAPGLVVTAPADSEARAILQEAVRPKIVAVRGAPLETAKTLAEALNEKNVAFWQDANSETGARWLFGAPPGRRGAEGAITALFSTPAR